MEVKEMKLVYPAHSKHYFYFREHISKFILEKNCVPLNPFMIFQYFMLDTVERDVVRNANNNLVKKSDETWVFGPISDGVLAEIRLAKKTNKPVKYFDIIKSKEIVEIDEKDVTFEENVPKINLASIENTARENQNKKENLEIEIRSFITKEQYESLLNFFNQNAEPVKEDFQETHYFDCEEDLRIQKNNSGSKIWMKKGKIHDNSREEIEIKFGNEEFNKLKEILSSIGLQTEVMWFRNRKQFNWKGIKICLDYTKGYGYIIELEKMASEENKEKTIEELNQKLMDLNIPLTSEEEFEKKFQYYKENWKELI